MSLKSKGGVNNITTNKDGSIRKGGYTAYDKRAEKRNKKLLKSNSTSTSSALWLAVFIGALSYAPELIDIFTK